MEVGEGKVQMQQVENHLDWETNRLEKGLRKVEIMGRINRFRLEGMEMEMEIGEVQIKKGH